MLKFISRVWIAGEINDYRRGYKKRKAIRKQQQRAKAIKNMNKIKESGLEERYNTVFLRMIISFLISFIALCISPLFIFSLIVSFVFTVEFALCLIKLLIIYSKIK